MKALRSSWFPVMLCIAFFTAFLGSAVFNTSPEQRATGSENEEWQAPDINLVPHGETGDMIYYGRDLIVNTAVYFGPGGKVAAITNGMNCQNCHLAAGIRLFGNSLTEVATTYPKYRERSGKTESIEFRVNECMVRSLNGKAIDSTTKEMRAMVAYIKWLGKNFRQDGNLPGTGIAEIAYMDRAADSRKGQSVYETTCSRCHGENGEGFKFAGATGYFYPPLWGQNSYNVSAGLYRISRLATFVKYNMPFDLTQSTPQLTDEEAWDVAAFVNSQPRPEKKFPQDWPKIETKPFDYPFGPYADHFSEQQHKYGPFGAMIKAGKSGSP